MLGTPRLLFLSVVVAVGASGGCSSGSDSAPSGTPADAGVEAGSVGESVTLFVRTVVSPLAVSALPNATVVFDKPGGERAVATTDARGLVTVTGIDWSLGTGAVTVLSNGTVPVSLTGLNKAELARLKAASAATAEGAPENDAVVSCVSRDRGGRQVSGTATHGRGRSLAVGATTSVTAFDGALGPFSFLADVGKPFAVVTLESSPAATSTVGPRGRELTFHRWTRTDLPAAGADVALDLDLDTATALAPTKTKLRVLLPGGNDGPLGGSSMLYVTTGDVHARDATVFGAAPRVDVAPDGSAFEVDYEHVDVDGVKPETTYSIALADRSASFGFVLGWPKDGQVVDGFLSPPVVVEAARSVTEPFAVDGVDPASTVQINVANGNGDDAWFIRAPPGTKSITIPKLEGDLAKGIGKTSSAVLLAYGSLDPELGGFSRVGVSRPFDFK